MAVRICDVKPLMDLSYQLFIKKETSTASLLVIADKLMRSRGSVGNGMGTVILDGVSTTFGPADAFGVKTADGVLVTDFSLLLRSMLMSLLAPSIGQKYSTDPMAMAETWRSASLRFFSGASLGGAVYDSKRWRISPHWLPIETPAPVALSYSTLDDPISRTLALFPVTDLDKENTQKAMRMSSDPYFILLKMGGTTLLSITQYTHLDVSGVKDWVPVLVEVPGGDDVLQRTGTFVGDDDNRVDWGSTAYDQFVNSGFVAASLQVPRVFTQPSILDRLVPDAGRAGRFWFRSTVKDYAFEGLTAESLAYMKANARALKLSWLDDMRGFNLKPSVLTAINASPLGYMVAGIQFKPGVTRTTDSPIEMTTNRRAWIRSDIGWSEKARWLADTSLTYIHRGWFKDVTDAQFAKLLEVK